MAIRNTLVLFGVLAGFGLVHSLLAGRGVKPQLARLFGERVVEGWYRLAYNVFAALTLIPAVVAYVLLPDRVLYQVETPWSALLRAVQFIGLVGLAGALFVTDVWSFLGLRQAAAYLRGDPLPLPAQPLQQGGMYRFVRHPLYFFSLLLIWATPTLTLNTLLVNTALTLYILIGSIVEERRLLRQFGDEYRAYQRRVSWLVPLPPRAVEVEPLGDSAATHSH